METVFERDQAAAYTSSRISWRAIMAGATVSIGVWILLHVMGLAAGLTSIDPHSPGSLRAAGIGTGIWSAIASLLALFAGGVLAGRIAGPVDRLGGALHGAVLWGLTTIAGLFLVVWAAGMVVQGAARVGSSVVSAAGGMASLADSSDPMEALGLKSMDLLAPLNQKLQEQGKPALTPDQVQSAVKEAVKGSVRQGRFDREILMSALQRNTALTRADVQDLATQVEQSVDKVGSRLDAAQTGALQAAESTGKGLWWVFGALLLGLFAALGGAALGVSPTQRRPVEDVRKMEFTTPLGSGFPVQSHIRPNGVDSVAIAGPDSAPRF